MVVCCKCEAFELYLSIKELNHVNIVLSQEFLC